MIKVNLVSEARAAKRTEARAAGPAVVGRAQKNITFLVLLAIGILYLIGMWLYLAGQRRQWNQKIQVAQQEVNRLKSIIDEVNAYQKKEADLQSKINLINQLKKNQKGPVRLMDEISQALPDLVWLTEMDVNGQTIAIQGKAMTPNAVANFIENLKKSHLFAEPTFDSMTQEGGGIYDFKLSVTFTYMAPASASSTTGAPPAAAPATPTAKAAA